MKFRWLLWLMIASPVMAQVANVTPAGVYYSASGIGGPWSPLMAAAGATPLGFNPPAYGMYYSSTGTPAGPWYPCTLALCFSGGGGGSGTVTHTAGALTAKQLVIGNGGADITVDPDAETDGAGNATVVSLTATGTGGSGTLVLNGSSSGSGTLTVPAAAGSGTITIPAATSGTMVVGPGVTTSGHITTWNSSAGGLVGDSGVPVTAIPAANIASGALANGMTATTQTVGDNTTKLATDAFVIANAGSGTPAYPLTITGGVSGGVVYGSSSTQLTVSPAGTANVLMKWGGAGTAPGNSLCTENGTSLTCTDTGGVVVVGVTTTGPSNGFYNFGYTGTPATGPGTNIFQISPAISITTPWSLSPAAAPATGFLFGTNTSSVVQQSFIGSTGTGNVVLAGSPTLTGVPVAPTAALGTNTTQIATTAFVLASTYLSGTTASIGGSLLAGAGSCTTGTATVTGVGAGNFPVGSPVAVSASDGSLPNGLVTLAASATATNTVTVSICAIAAVTPTAKTYNVAVF